jgi:hypothetical protein
MPDSPTLRVQRHRRHAANDHSLCRADRCPDAGRAAVRLVAAPGAAEGLDPALELRRSAARLAAACEANPGNALLARELRETLTRIPSAGPGPVAGDSLEQLSLAGLGWSPGGDPELRELAETLLVDHGLAFLRGWWIRSPDF